LSINILALNIPAAKELQRSAVFCCLSVFQLLKLQLMFFQHEIGRVFNNKSDEKAPNTVTFLTMWKISN